MPAARMIPALWVRLVVIIGFGVFVSTQHMTWIAVAAVFLAVLTGAQLVTAYKEKERQARQ